MRRSFKDYVDAERFVDEYRGDTGIEVWVVELFDTPLSSRGFGDWLGQLYVVDAEGLAELEGSDFEVQYP